MTPAARGVNSENYFTALDGYEGDTGAGGSSGGPSEAPSIRSPFKPKMRGYGDRRAKAMEGSRMTGGSRETAGLTTTRKGRTPKRK
jgi:hypothetical protein